MLIYLFFLFVAIDTSSNYKVTSNLQNLTHIVLGLEYTGSEEYYIKPTSGIYKQLTFTLVCHTYSDLSFTITDTNNKRFRIPTSAPFPQDPFSRSTFPLNLSLFNVSYNSNPFELKILRNPDQTILFDTTGQDIVFSQHYIQIGTKVATRYAWGFGERFSSDFSLKKGKYTIFNRDRPNTIDHQDGHNTYGSFPIYLMRDSSNKQSTYHMNYFRNSNAMDVVIQQIQNDSFKFTYKSIGGMIDFRLLLENTASSVVQRFHNYLGASAVPPFWSMGFHQSRWGYLDIQIFEQVIKQYKDNQIPLDTIWSDIDYMINFEDFTINQDRFPLEKLNAIAKQYHYVPIIDAGIKVNDGTAYLQGKAKDLFIKNAVGEEFHGVVWPGKTTFVDFLHPQSINYWKRMLDILYQKVKFSGIWLDMNEVSNFCPGPCIFPDHVGFDFSNDLPYQPGAQGEGVEMQTISLNCSRYGNLTEADVHIYTGFLQTVATNEFLQSKNMRPFILSRSTAPGLGSYGFHWTGDNEASFDFLRNSIHENFLFQIWGIQMVGADICGFVKNTTKQLCARWFQLGAFYPFSRNHNHFWYSDQQPYALGPDVLQASKTNIKLRYSLLKSYYRIFIMKRGFGAIFQPLFFVFSDDLIILQQKDTSETQFMIGQQLLFAPIVQNGTNTRYVYFPVGFYNYHNSNYHQAKSNVSITNNITEAVPVFLRQGYGVFVQDTSNITKSVDLNNVFQFKAGLIQVNSSDSVKVYSTSGSLLSIQNYNDQSKISKCINEGCLFKTNWIITQYSNGTKQFQVSSVFVGSSSLRQSQLIQKLTLYKPNGSIIYTLPSPLVIKTTETQTIIMSQIEEQI